MTQIQLSHVVCTSLKAIQSYEQGWRDIPTSVEREMLLLLALKRSANRNISPSPCWEIKDCSDEWRSNCLVWKLKAKHFCWFINGTFCQGKIQKNWEEKIQKCRECEVYQNILATEPEEKMVD